ncbi:MAG: hypothetical protein M1839_003607 [Geoglossum umbratile]|nr:MAG: hypothetical protein M1839_003607 [Geoglossum umbratile]
MDIFGTIYADLNDSAIIQHWQEVPGAKQPNIHPAGWRSAVIAADAFLIVSIVWGVVSLALAVRISTFSGSSEIAVVAVNIDRPYPYSRSLRVLVVDGLDIFFAIATAAYWSGLFVTESGRSLHGVEGIRGRGFFLQMLGPGFWMLWAVVVAKLLAHTLPPLLGACCKLRPAPVCPTCARAL